MQLMQPQKQSQKKGLPEIFSGLHFATAHNYCNEKQETFKRRIWMELGILLHGKVLRISQVWCETKHSFIQQFTWGQSEISSFSLSSPHPRPPPRAPCRRLGGEAKRWMTFQTNKRILFTLHNRARFLKQKGLLALIQDKNFTPYFLFYLPICCLKWHFVSSLIFLGVKAQQCFVSSRCMFLEKKTLLKIWLNPGLNLIIFRGTGPRFLNQRHLWRSYCKKRERKKIKQELVSPMSVSFD